MNNLNITCILFCFNVLVFHRVLSVEVSQNYIQTCQVTMEQNLYLRKIVALDTFRTCGEDTFLSLEPSEEPQPRHESSLTPSNRALDQAKSVSIITSTIIKPTITTSLQTYQLRFRGSIIPTTIEVTKSINITITKTTEQQAPQSDIAT